MGGKSSKEDFYDDTALMDKVRRDQQVIMAENEKNIQEFFATVDRTVLIEGAPNTQTIQDLEKEKEGELSNIQHQQQEAGHKPLPTDGANGASTDPPQEETKIPHKSADGVLVILNQASVYYAQSHEKSPKTLKGLTDIARNVINELRGAAKAGKEVKPDTSKPATEVPATAAKMGAAMVGGPLISALTTLFATDKAVDAAVNGIFGAVNVLLSSMESQVTVSSSLQKSIQFVSPGLYCATYYSQSAFTFKDSKKTLQYNLQSAGVYLVTSVKLVQTIASLTMYKTICEAFEYKLAKCQEELNKYVDVYSDLSYMLNCFGFNERYKNTLLAKVKTDVMKTVVQSFWDTYADDSNKDRTEMWVDYTESGRLQKTIDNCQTSYGIAFKDLQDYYDKFVKNPVTIGQ